MKKIPTLFEREFKDHNVINVLPNVTKGMEWVLGNEGIATIKYDGSCCAILDDVFYKRYDAKADPFRKAQLNVRRKRIRLPGIYHAG
jgi:hypothetical protein